MKAKIKMYLPHKVALLIRKELHILEFRLKHLKFFVILEGVKLNGVFKDDISRILMEIGDDNFLLSL